MDKWMNSNRWTYITFFRHSVGNADAPFTLQSGGKCFNYSIGLDEVGREKVSDII